METWIRISEYFGNRCYYEVSNYGRIRSINNNGNIRYLKQVKFGSGYLGVRLRNNKGTFSVYTHRLVATYFVENTFYKPQVNHKDGDKTNNNASNLSWATVKENIIHSYKIGKSKTGENRHLTKYTNNQVREIRKRYDSGMRICDICRIFNYDKSSVYLIVKRLTYKDVIN